MRLDGGGSLGVKESLADAEAAMSVRSNSRRRANAADTEVDAGVPVMEAASLEDMGVVPDAVVFLLSVAVLKRLRRSRMVAGVWWRALRDDSGVAGTALRRPGPVRRGHVEASATPLGPGVDCCCCDWSALRARSASRCFFEPRTPGVEGAAGVLLTMALEVTTNKSAHHNKTMEMAIAMAIAIATYMRCCVTVWGLPERPYLACKN